MLYKCKNIVLSAAAKRTLLLNKFITVQLFTAIEFVLSLMYFFFLYLHCGHSVQIYMSVIGRLCLEKLAFLIIASDVKRCKILKLDNLICFN